MTDEENERLRTEVEQLSHERDEEKRGRKQLAHAATCLADFVESKPGIRYDAHAASLLVRNVRAALETEP